MTTGFGVNASAQRLTLLTQDLLQAIAAVQSWGERGRLNATEPVQRYLATLMDGLQSGDPAQVIRGARMLTTVNKGIGDLIQGSEDQHLGDPASDVQDAALQLIRQLHANDPSG